MEISNMFITRISRFAPAFCALFIAVSVFVADRASAEAAAPDASSPPPSSGVSSKPSAPATGVPAAENGVSSESAAPATEAPVSEKEASAENKSSAGSAEDAASTAVPRDATTEIIADPVGAFKKFSKDFVDKHFNVKEFSLWRIIFLAIGIALTLALARITRWIVERYGARLASKTKTEIDDLTCEALGKPSGLLVFSIGLYISSYPMMKLLSGTLQVGYGRACLALAASSVAWALYRMVTVVDHVLTKLAAKTDTNLDDLIVAIVRKSLKITVVLFSIFFIGQNILHLNITTLLAGAGVAGLAIAFAAQDTISNFFGSIMIILDQPFCVGDCVSISGYKGAVENVGFRSTRIRTFDGHLISIPNKDVAGADIENISARPFIKQAFNLGLVYDSGVEKMERAVELLHEILDGQPCMDDSRPPRIVFESFGDWSLNISATVWWHCKDEDGENIPPDYGAFMKWIHETNMEILRRFDKEGLEFAFPTNTTYFARDSKREPRIVVAKD